LRHLNSTQIAKLMEYKKQGKSGKALLLLLSALTLPHGAAWAQGADKVVKGSLLGETGIIITIILLLIPLLFAIVFLILKLSNALNNAKNKKYLEEAAELAAYLRTLPEEEITGELKKRKAALDYALSHKELSGNEPAEDERGLLQINQQTGMPIVAIKKK